MADLTSFIAGLPKAELHVHHVGSASPRIVAELAGRHEGETDVPADPAALADFFAFRDFRHFIDVYLKVVDLIRDDEDVRTLTYEVGRELARQQVRYAELTVTPYSHVRRGIAAPEFCAAIEDARRSAERELGIVLRWMEGTALRPVKAALDENAWESFRAHLGRELAAAYPAAHGHVAFPFRRVFVVARTAA